MTTGAAGAAGYFDRYCSLPIEAASAIGEYSGAGTAKTAIDSIENIKGI